MVGNLQPLDQKFQIVDAQGRPTEYFTRWAQQKQIDIGDSITLADLQDYLTAHKLIAGTGIQLTPDGDINSPPTIHADVQAILDEVTATRGAMLYRGLLGWAALLPGAAGNILSTNGTGADPTWIPPAAGGGGGWTLITDTLLAANAATISFAAIPTTYRDLRIEYEARQTAAADVEFYAQFNADTGANYTFYVENRFGTTSNAAATMLRCGTCASSGTVAGQYSFGAIDIYGYLDARFKNLHSSGFYPVGLFEDRNSGAWKSNVAINAVKLLFSGAQIFVAGSRFRLYGGM